MVYRIIFLVDGPKVFLSVADVNCKNGVPHHVLGGKELDALSKVLISSLKEIESLKMDKITFEEIEEMTK